MSSRLELTEQRFGRLTAHWPTGRGKSGKIYWLCSCACGNLCPKILSNHLKNGNSKSCGCLQKEVAAKTGHNRLLPNGGSCFNALYYKYGIEAERRSLSFSLSEDRFRDLLQSNCHYCGRQPNQLYRTSDSSSQYIYTGIDRKNNAIGYEDDNVLPCCKICNFMKMKLGYDEFISTCKLIAARFA